MIIELGQLWKKIRREMKGRIPYQPIDENHQTTRKQGHGEAQIWEQSTHSRMWTWDLPLMEMREKESGWKEIVFCFVFFAS